MYNFLLKHGQLAAFGLGLLIIAIYLISVVSGLGSFNALPEEEQATTSIFNVGLYAALALVILGALIAMFFGVYYMVTHPKDAIKGLIGLAAIVIVFIIAYTMADPEATGRLSELLQKNNIGPNTSKYITGALTTTLILACIAALAFVVAEVRNLFK